MRRPITHAALGIALAFVPALSLAGSYDSRYGGSNVATLLLPEHDVQVTAFGLYLQGMDAYPETGDSLGNQTRKFRTKAETKLNGATIARAEYRLKSQPAGDPLVTIHAASGPSIKSRMGRAMGKSGSGSSGDEREGRSSADNIVQDAAEARDYYPPETPREFRARNFEPHEGGVIATREVDGRLTHFADAELKIAGTLEQGFLDNSIPRGGDLVVYVSQEVCDSCRANLVDLAEAYDVDIKVYHLAAPGTTGAIPMLDEARKAGRELLQVRKAQTQFMLKDAARNDVHLGSWSSSMRRVERLERDLGDLRFCL